MSYVFLAQLDKEKHSGYLHWLNSRIVLIFLKTIKIRSTCSLLKEENIP